jgi:predicted glycoside hydrolase/deacetylase ChbG (UPF0249 family)
MAIRLIVNADDYGRTPGVSTGIRESHLRGIVTSTTVMMNMPAVEADLHQALRECPTLGLGVHLVLTSGAPVLPLAQVSSLTNGKPIFPGLDEQKERLNQIDANQAKAEWRAQIERFVTITGRAPDHLDSHHHFSYFSEPLFRAMLELADEYGCPIRLPRPTHDGSMAGLPAELVPQIMAFAPRLMREFDPRCPDRFDATFYDQQATRTVLLNLLANLPDGMTELMCHPGYADAEILAGSTYNRQRETELTVLTDPAVMAVVKERDIHLVTFQSLART